LYLIFKGFVKGFSKEEKEFFSLTKLRFFIWFTFLSKKHLGPMGWVFREFGSRWNRISTFYGPQGRRSLDCRDLDNSRLRSYGSGDSKEKRNSFFAFNLLIFNFLF